MGSITMIHQSLRKLKIRSLVSKMNSLKVILKTYLRIKVVTPLLVRLSTIQTELDLTTQKQMIYHATRFIQRAKNHNSESIEGAFLDAFLRKKKSHLNQ